MVNIDVDIIVIIINVSIHGHLYSLVPAKTKIEVPRHHNKGCSRGVSSEKQKCQKSH